MLMSDFLDRMNKFLRSKETVRAVAKKIHKIFHRIERERDIGEVIIMNFCGTHEYTITYYGLRSLMPENLELIAGPGCPVCVTPAKVIDKAIEISKMDTVLTYGDMYKVPGTRQSLANARSYGAKVRIVYGFGDAIQIARRNPSENYAFLGVGFETTAPTVASYVVRRLVPKNLSILTSYRITVSVMEYILKTQRHRLSGIIAPGHVSTIVGASAWRVVSDDYGVPIVVSGFEPLDVMLSIYEILKQVLSGEPKLVNQYSRVVKSEGNLVAKKYLDEAFDIVDGDWRGIGRIPNSAWRLRDEFQEYDADVKYGIEIKDSVDIKPGCKCAEITLGLAKPTDCPYYKKACTPEHPIGPCMVSSEGTCSIWYRFGGEESIKMKIKIE